MSKKATHDRLLQAGREILVEDAINIIKRGLIVDQVKQRAGVTPQTFHNHYPKDPLTGVMGGKEKFIDELLSSLVIKSSSSTQNQLTDQIHNLLVANNGDPRRALRELCKWDFQQIRSDPATIMRLLTAAVARDHPQAIENIRHEYREMTDIGEQAYDATLARWGATLRSPFTTRNIGVVLTALVEGLTLRWLVDAPSVSDDLLGEAVIAIVGSVVDVEQRHEHIDDVMTPLTNEAMREFRLASRGDLHDEPEKAILEAARTEFAQRGYFSTLLTHISSTAGVDLPTLKRAFPTKADIVVEGLQPAFAEVKKGIDRDVRLGRAEHDTVKRDLTRLAEQAIENQIMFDALMTLVTHDTVRAPETLIHIKDELNFPALISPVIVSGQQTGVFSDSFPAMEIAATLTNTLLLRCFTRRDEPAEFIAATVSEMFLNGICVRT